MRTSSANLHRAEDGFDSIRSKNTPTRFEEILNHLFIDIYSLYLYGDRF